MTYYTANEKFCPSNTEFINNISQNQKHFLFWLTLFGTLVHRQGHSSRTTDRNAMTS